jgi:hypothetical protein
MKPYSFAAFVLSLLCLSNARAADLDKLKVLYVGESLDNPRARQYIGFLEKNVGKVEGVERHAFRQPQAADFDVVLLDWPQSRMTEQEWRMPAPLGDRSTWNKPTVLLGSAGLNLAVVWKVRGGSG